MSETPKLRRSADAYQDLFSYCPVKLHCEYFDNLSKSGIHSVQGETTNIIIIFLFLPSLLYYYIINPLSNTFERKLK